MDNETLLEGHYVLLRADSLRMLLPQASVGAAEYRDAASCAGRTVVAPSGRLRPLDEVPAGRFVLTQLAASGEGSAWFAWDEVHVLIAVKLRARPLPPALRATGMPFTAYVEIDGEVVLCADPVALGAYMHACMETTS